MAASSRSNNQVRDDHVEFSVKASEDLFLQGSQSTIRRVAAETNYSCLMLKTQRFSSLFRHYAKYHGLKKDELEYYFVDVLENDESPESVQLQRGDTIMVRKRRIPEATEPVVNFKAFFSDMKRLLEDDEHKDVVFVVRHPPSSEGTNDIIRIRAHKSVLTARTEYFKNLFRKRDNVFVGTIEVAFSETIVRQALEFIYTNRIPDLHKVGTTDLVSLLHLSELWSLRDMKRLVELSLVQHHLSTENVAWLYGATEHTAAKRLARVCIEFIMGHLRDLAGNSTFEDEMKKYPHLCIPVLKHAAELIPDGPPLKKQRSVELSGGGTPSSATAAFRSSPVLDSDP